MPSIVCIVEGHSEVESVPLLIRRILHNNHIFDFEIEKPLRNKRNKIIKENELERAIQLAEKSRKDPGCIMIILDVDDDCPAELGPPLLERAKKSTHLPVSVVLANKEFEAWFLGAKESLRGINQIKDDANNPEDPEAIRGAKGRLTRNMEDGHYYQEILQQPSFVQQMDIDMAKNNCPSFRRFYNEVIRLASEINIEL
jgi:Domain of unknown function (DUF4276)